MEITEVRIFPRESQDKKLRAYATVTFDNAFVVRNIKVIQGSNGLFIAMPSRKVKQPCSKCGFRNESRSKFCNQCGAQLPQVSRPVSVSDTESEHKDICHPITQTFREYLQKKVIDAFEKEAASPSSRQTGSSVGDISDL